MAAFEGTSLVIQVGHKTVNGLCSRIFENSEAGRQIGNGSGGGILDRINGDRFCDSASAEGGSAAVGAGVDIGAA